MTDNEIIKALKCYLITNKCTKLGTDILDLINRQKAEIEKLKSEKEAIDDFINPLPFKTSFDFAKKVKSEAIREVAERIKLKADKECERELASYGNYYGRSFIRPTDSDVYIKSYKISEVDLDNLVKEMTEGGDGDSKDENDYKYLVAAKVVKRCVKRCDKAFEILSTEQQGNNDKEDNNG